MLFLLYIYLNDIHRVSNLLKFHLFTDDTSLLFPHKEEHVIEEIVKQEHKQVNNWLSENKGALDKNPMLTNVYEKKNYPKYSRTNGGIVSFIHPLAELAIEHFLLNSL